MLLTTGILLASLLTTSQDAVAPPSPDTPAQPETAPQSAEDAGQAALDLLARAQRRLYDVQATGLTSLSFSVPIRMGSPTGDTINLGDVAVDWLVSSDPKIAVTASDSLPPELVQQAEAISFQLEAQGQQVLRFVDNNIFAGLLEGYDASLVGQDGDLVRVHFEPKEQDSGAPTLDWLFDTDDVPVMFEMTVSQGDMSMNISYEHTWVPASATDDSLVLQQLTIVQEMGLMRNVITTTLDHQEISGLVMLVGYTESGLTPQGDVISNDVRLEGLSVTTRQAAKGG